MTDQQDQDSIIQDIIKSYPENEWLKQCRSKLPEADDDEILSTIEILCGGDIEELTE
ncbi:MAG: hypothetical protein WCG16_10845 [Methylococcales bacterium]